MTGRITDVPGVRVDHHTLVDGGIRTGVTAILPHEGDVFRDRPVAATYVLNGFGKSVGPMQIDELGQLETPILLTNTLSIGTCANALIRRAVAANPVIRRRLSTVNPVVGECNGGFLSDIQAMAITEADAFAALNAADIEFASGAVGAGAGMSCFAFKGGTASREIRLDKTAFRLGVLALCSFGRAGDLRLQDGRRVRPIAPSAPENGSVIVVIATDIRLDHRQLRRVIRRRGGVGQARVGSVWGHGSGDVFFGYSTANRTPLNATSDILPVRMLAEPRIDAVRRHGGRHSGRRDRRADGSDTTIGRGGNTRPSLRSVLDAS
jgi:D-aminopeptidase